MSLHVTQHAVERYCERVENLPANSVKHTIISAIEKPWSKVGDGAFPLGKGFMAVVSNSNVVTVVHRDMIQPGVPIVRDWKKKLLRENTK